MVGNKIRHIRREKNTTKEHQIKNKIVHSVCLGRHVLVALFGGEVIYLELDK